MAITDPNKIITGADTAAPAAPATGTAPASPASPVSGSAGTGYNSARVDAINQMYDAQQAARQQEMQSAYTSQMSAAQAAAGQIPQQYQQRANDLTVQYERNRRNLNEQAAANGLNTGAASQQALALQSTWQRDYGGIQQAQANAQAEAERAMADLTAQYESGVQQALAQNDYQRAAALLDEYNNAQTRDLQAAQILAQFGDFSGYAALYGAEQARNMADVWKYQNPDLAWNLGKMTGEEYFRATGVYPRGYTGAGAVGGGFWDGGNWGGNSSGSGGGLTNAPVQDPYSSTGGGVTSVYAGKPLDGYAPVRTVIPQAETTVVPGTYGAGNPLRG